MRDNALPYVEPAPLADVYDDACDTASQYPVRPMPTEELADRFAAEVRWQEICEEISAHGGLAHPYLE